MNDRKPICFHEFKHVPADQYGEPYGGSHEPYCIHCGRRKSAIDPGYNKLLMYEAEQAIKRNQITKQTTPETWAKQLGRDLGNLTD